jgi:hypothetical protein
MAIGGGATTSMATASMAIRRGATTFKTQKTNTINLL